MVLSPSMLNVVATSLIFRLASTGNRKIALQDLSHVFSTTLLEQKTSLKQTEKLYGQRPKAGQRKGSVFVYKACHNEISLTEWLKQQMFSFSQCWRLEV